MTPTSDLHRVTLEWMQGVAKGGLLAYQVLTEPKPKNVPQATRWGGVYYSKGFTACYAECQKQLAPQAAGKTVAGDLVVLVEVVVTKARTSKRTRPQGDADNYLKAILDAGTKSGLWIDDDQITFVSGFKRYAEPGEFPGFYVHVAPLS